MILDTLNYMLKVCDYSAQYWVWLGTIALIVLTVQDFKNNGYIDDRKNYFMMGAAAMLLSHFPTKIWYLFFLLFFGIFFNLLMKMLKLVGDGDTNILTWILYGYGIVNVFYFFWFAIIFIVVTILFHILKDIVFKYKGVSPFCHVILIAFLINNLLFQLYL